MSLAALSRRACCLARPRTDPGEKPIDKALHHLLEADLLGILIILDLSPHDAGDEELRCNSRFNKKDLGWNEEKWGKGYRASEPAPGQPECSCGGRIVSSIINFGDPMPEEEIEQAIAHSQRADLFFVIGSSLAVMPANQMPLYAKSRGARLIILNRGETSLDSQADLLIQHSIGEVLPVIVDRVESDLEVDVN